MIKPTITQELSRSTVAVLWSVALSRLALGIAALTLTEKTHAASFSSLATTLWAGSEVRWRSQGAAVLLVVAWAGLEATSRLDPGWRDLRLRRRVIANPPFSPDLASRALAVVTGIGAGLTAASASRLFFGEVDVWLTGSWSSVLSFQITTAALLAVGVLVIGTPATFGNTVAAALTAGGVGSLLTAVYAGLESGQLLISVSAWLVALLGAGAVAASSAWERARRRMTALVRRQHVSKL